MSRDYWESRWQSGDMHSDKGAPSPGLVDFLAAQTGAPPAGKPGARPLALRRKLSLLRRTVPLRLGQWANQYPGWLT